MDHTSSTPSTLSAPRHVAPQDPMGDFLQQMAARAPRECLEALTASKVDVAPWGKRLVQGLEQGMKGSGQGRRVEFLEALALAGAHREPGPSVTEMAVPGLFNASYRARMDTIYIMRAHATKADILRMPVVMATHVRKRDVDTHRAHMAVGDFVQLVKHKNVSHRAIADISQSAYDVLTKARTTTAVTRERHLLGHILFQMNSPHPATGAHIEREIEKGIARSTDTRGTHSQINIMLSGGIDAYVKAGASDESLMGICGILMKMTCDPTVDPQQHQMAAAAMASLMSKFEKAT